ncbi:MAG TPA: hypothetical protein VD908_15065 [Cytophagales bacterium]|nr:hypothetical protein [Cytophagales bacterium]
MPELLKNLYTVELIKNLSIVLKNSWGAFEDKNFQEFVLDDNWPAKELKQRMRHITVSLNAFLPGEYVKALDILKQTAPQFNGFLYMFFPDYVEAYGSEYEEESMNALELFTQFSSSEFAIRLS